MKTTFLRFSNFSLNFQNILNKATTYRHKKKKFIHIFKKITKNKRIIKYSLNSIFLFITLIQFLEYEVKLADYIYIHTSC